MSEGRKYLRFPLAVRVEHWVAMGSFTVLAVTGLVQKFAQAEVSVAIVALLGGIENVRLIHRVAAIALMLEVIYHIGFVGYRFFVKRSSLPMLPSFDDLANAWQTLRYYFGASPSRPQQGRYTFEEKLEYWAFVWGTMIMVITGFMLWNPIATTNLLPGQAIPAAKAAHGNEALLAVLAIVLWHFYHVHIRHFNKSMFTGYISEEEMLEEHPKELADRKAGLAQPSLDPQRVRRRQRVYLPIFGVLATGLLVGLYAFATFERTAIETVPTPEGDVAVFVPFTPTPVPTEAPTQPPTEGAIPTTWQDGIADLFQRSCGACHSGDEPAGGLDISTYEGTLDGGTSGPGVVPGDPEASEIIARQVTGDHPGQFSGQELDLIKDWIERGAPEQ